MPSRAISEDVAVNERDEEDKSKEEDEVPINYGMGKYKFGTMLCCLFNFALTVLIFVLMFSFISGGKVYVSVVGEDLRFETALECVPTPKADNRVCGVLEKNEPIPDGWRLMATNDV